MSPYLYYIGHSTVFLRLGGQSFLTDPLLTRHVSFLRRRGPVPPLPDFGDSQYTPTVLLSHAHRDHLHLRSLQKVGEDVNIFAPTHATDMLRRKGFSYAESIKAGQEMSLGGVEVRAIHSEHNGERNGNGGSALGYLLDDGERQVYFAGDTDLLPDLGDEVEGVDVALIPISGWGPNLGEGHLDPVSAAKQTEIINPGVVIPIHYGPFSPWFIPRSLLVSSGAEDEFFRELYRRGIDQKLRLLEPGQFFSFSD